MFFLGTNDPVFPFAGVLGLLLSGTETLEKWAELDACPDAAQETQLSDTADDGTLVSVLSYGDCDGGSEVIGHIIVGGGHTWPGSAFEANAELGRTSHDVSASQTMIDFFLRHRRGALD
jgi:polyhydroxybutyrate depolymerase